MPCSCSDMARLGSCSGKKREGFREATVRCQLDDGQGITDPEESVRPPQQLRKPPETKSPFYSVLLCSGPQMARPYPVQFCTPHFKGEYINRGTWWSCGLNRRRLCCRVRRPSSRKIESTRQSELPSPVPAPANLAVRKHANASR